MKTSLVTTCACILAFVFARVATAQERVFVEGFSELTLAVAGTFGDEGVAIGPALDKMASGLAGWDRTRLETTRAESRPGDPIAAYHELRRAATIARAGTSDVQGARDTLVAAYRTLLREKPRSRTRPFASLDLLQSGASDAPLLPPAAYAAGFARIARREYSEAIAEFRKAAASDPLITDPAARSSSMRQAIAELKQGRLADARARLEGGGARQDSSETRRVLGLIEWLSTRNEQSIEHFEAAIRANARDERSRIALARVLSSVGRDADAERVLKETLAILPDSVLARWWLGLAYERRHQLADARREFEAAASGAVAGRSQFFTKIGQLATSAADLEGAVEAFARAVDADLNDPDAHKRMAGAYLQLDRVDESFVELVATLLIDPVDAGAFAGIGQIQLDSGRLDDAVASLRRAVELSPDFTEARYALATALKRSGQADEAGREFARVEQSQQKALADRRRTMSVDVLKGEALLRAAEGRTSDAIALLEQALPLGADSDVYRNLADLYEKAGRLEDAARARARIAPK